MSDVGAASGPLIAGAVAGVATLGVASIVVGLVGVAGAVVFQLTLPPREEPSPVVVDASR